MKRTMLLAAYGMALCLNVGVEQTVEDSVGRGIVRITRSRCNPFIVERLRPVEAFYSDPIITETSTEIQIVVPRSSCFGPGELTLTFQKPIQPPPHDDTTVEATVDAAPPTIPGLR